MTQIERDISKGQLVILKFGRADVAAGLTDSALAGDDPSANTFDVPAFDGEILGLGWGLSAAATAGTGSFSATIGGTKDTNTTVTIPIDSTTTAGFLKIPRGKSRFTAGQKLGVVATTAAGWLPITTDLGVVMHVLLYVEGV